MLVQDDQARVKAFNSLPCNRLSPSGSVPNTWHFDLRYISIDPPSHMLFFYQPDSSFVHSETLPLGKGYHQAGIAFFPETGEEAAPEVARALMHGFLDGFGNGRFEKNPPPPFAPFKLMTDDPTLARAVGMEFRRIGVTHKGLWDIQITPANKVKDAHESFERIYGHIKSSIGLKDLAFHAYETPGGIVFLKPSEYAKFEVEEEDFARAVAYVNQLRNAKLPGEDFDGNAMMKEADKLVQHFEAKPLDIVRREADTGNGMSAIDYALRVQNGIGCTPDRALIREYLVKAIQSPSNDVTKSIAHSLLIRWYAGALKPEYGLPVRYLFAASYHADQAVALAQGKASPAALFFGIRTMKPAAETVFQLYAQFKNVWSAVDKRDKETDAERNEAQKKRMEKPNRYRCANVGCLIQSNTGKMLSQCSGKCDPDKKPSYCSRECQKADWKNHKPFCKPGQPCSVIDPEPDHGLGKTRGGAISIPIEQPDGRTTLFSSSTMSAQELKKIKEGIENMASKD